MPGEETVALPRHTRTVFEMIDHDESVYQFTQYCRAEGKALCRSSLGGVMKLFGGGGRPGIEPKPMRKPLKHVVEGDNKLRLSQTHLLMTGDGMSNLSSFSQAGDTFHRKCKIICTMGPACWDTDKLVELIDAGMNVCRLNFSHGDHEGHGATVKRIRAAAARRPNKPVAVLLDTKGPEIRTGFFREDVGKSIELKQGQELKLVVDYNFKGDNTCFALSYDKLCTSVKPGNIILLADGSLSLKVKSVAADHVITEVQNNCKMGERKNCNLPGVKVELPVLQDKDIKDLVEFGIPHDVDFIAASFVQSADDVKMIRGVLGKAGAHIKIISKIENQEGLKNFAEIVEASDAIMVARGDLGMEIPPEKVFLAQKMMINICNIKGKPVVTATQMLESMVTMPRPTRAECSDVANAVLDGTDCVMLSGETANGAFPVNAVTIMRNVCQKAEGSLDYNAAFLHLREAVLDSCECVLSSLEALASSAVETSMDVQAKVIVCLTESGASAQVIAKYRPKCPVVALSTCARTVRQLNIVRGVAAVQIDAFSGKEDPVNAALYWAKLHGLAVPGDLAVVVHGQIEEGKASRSSPRRRGSLLVDADLKTGSTTQSNLVAISQVPY